MDVVFNLLKISKSLQAALDAGTERQGGGDAAGPASPTSPDEEDVRIGGGLVCHSFWSYCGVFGLAFPALLVRWDDACDGNAHRPPHAPAL